MYQNLFPGPHPLLFVKSKAQKNLQWSSSDSEHKTKVIPFSALLIEPPSHIPAHHYFRAENKLIRSAFRACLSVALAHLSSIISDCALIHTQPFNELYMLPKILSTFLSLGFCFLCLESNFSQPRFVKILLLLQALVYFVLFLCSFLNWMFI